MEKNTKYQQTYVITEDVFAGFISVFNDSNPLHTSELFAREKGFKAKVMHGNILNGFISHFIGECLPIKNVIIHSQEINYYQPVYLNDSLQLIVEIKEFFESVSTFELIFYFLNQNHIKVAKGKISIGLL